MKDFSICISLDTSLSTQGQHITEPEVIHMVKIDFICTAIFSARLNLVVIKTHNRAHHHPPKMCCLYMLRLFFLNSPMVSVDSNANKNIWVEMFYKKKFTH